jgi:hypothetical protein
MSEQHHRRSQPSEWATGGILFAAALLLLIGTFQIIGGLSAIIDDNFYVVGHHYAFNLDTTAWGWIHLFIGILLVGTAWGLSKAATWARVAAIVLTIFSAITNFLFIPYYPFWSILVIALDVWILYALTRADVWDAFKRDE